jgi:hypothetical protein
MDAKESFLTALAAVRKIQADLDQQAGMRSKASTTTNPPLAPTKHRMPDVPTPLRTPEMSATPATDDKPIKVLVSWAHTDEGWNESETTAWEAEVMRFTLGLIDSGIDADIDLFHSHDKLADWTRFGQKAVEESDYVLVAISKPWADRWFGNNKPTVGAGVAVEADTLKGIFSKNQEALQNKLKIVVLASKRADDIPHDMNRFQRFRIDADKRDSYTDLLRTITNQPLYIKPKLGKVPVLAPAALDRSFRMVPADDMVAYSPRASERTDGLHGRSSSLRKSPSAIRAEYDFISAELKLGKLGRVEVETALERMSQLRKMLARMESRENG